MIVLLLLCAGAVIVFMARTEKDSSNAVGLPEPTGEPGTPALAGEESEDEFGRHHREGQGQETVDVEPPRSPAAVEIVCLALPERRPLEGIPFSVRQVTGGVPAQAVRSARSDADGRASFSVEAGAWAISSPLWRGDVCSLAPGETRSFEVLLAEPAEVRGRVVDRSGAPVAGASIWRMRTPGLLDLEADPTATSDAGGEFELVTFADASSLVAWREGYQISMTQHLPRVQERAGSVEIVLLDGGALVHVLCLEQASNRPLADVEVELHGEWEPREYMAWVGEHDSVPPGRLKLVTDAQGRVTFRGVPDASRRHVMARAPGYRIGELIELASAPEEEVVLLLERGLTLRGRLEAEAGEDLGGVQVFVTPLAGDERAERKEERRRWTMTGPDGRFTLEGADEGWNEIRCYWQDMRHEWKLPLGPGTEELRLRLQGVSRSGRVHGCGDLERLHLMSPRVVARESGSPVLVASATLGVDGSFALRLPATCELELQLLVGPGAGLPLARVDWREPAPEGAIELHCDHDADSLGSVRGRVPATSDREAFSLMLSIEDLDVLLPDPRYWPETGEFASEPLLPGSYELAVRSGGELLVARRFELGAGERIDLGLLDRE